MKNFLPVTFLLLFVFLFSACDSEDSKKEEPAPAATAEMNRGIAYSYNDPQSADAISYGGMSLDKYASLDTERLTVSFSAVPQIQDSDAISFSINKSQLTGNYVGIYTIKSLPNPGAGAANVLYIYRNEANRSTMYLSNASTMEGHFTITAYNAKHNLISGSYEVKMKNAFDPKATQINQSDMRRCDITIQGSFANVKIVE